MEHLVYLFDGFHLDVARRRLCTSGGVVLPVNSRAMEALLLLVANAGRLVDKRRLMETVWPEAVVEDNNLNQCILAIRKALGEAAGSNRYIMTVPGRGYCFVCPVHERRLDDDGRPPDPPLSRARRIGLTAAALLPVAVLMLAAILQPPAPAPQGSGGTAEPAFVLRLRSASPESPVAAPSLLAGCLAREPRLHLEVSVRLVREDGRALWAGDFLAGRDDLLSLQEAASTAAPCPGATAR